jgi:hypothetical protein
METLTTKQMILRAIWFNKYGEFHSIVRTENGHRQLTDFEKNKIYKFIKLSRGKILSKKEIETQTSQNLLSQYGGDYLNGWLWVGNQTKDNSSYNHSKLRLMLKYEYPRHFKKHFGKQKIRL